MSFETNEFGDMMPSERDLSFQEQLAKQTFRGYFVDMSESEEEEELGYQVRFTESPDNPADKLIMARDHYVFSGDDSREVVALAPYFELHTGSDIILLKRDTITRQVGPMEVFQLDAPRIHAPRHIPSRISISEVIDVLVGMLDDYDLWDQHRTTFLEAAMTMRYNWDSFPTHDEDEE